MTDDAALYALAHAAQKKAVRARRRKQNTVQCLRPRQVEPLLSPKQQTGFDAEQRAVQHLQSCGMIIVGRNLLSKTGEIDIVAIDKETLVFIEVRHRRSQQYGGALASVNRGKQRRLIKAAHYFLPRIVQRHFAGCTPPCRFDVIGEEAQGLVWIRNAFSA